MEIKEDVEVEVEGEEGGDGTERALVTPEFRTQETEPSGEILVDARNSFNKLSRLSMMWNLQHRWPAGARFVFNCYRHWAQLLLCQPGEAPVTILSLEGVTREKPSNWYCM